MLPLQKNICIFFHRESSNFYNKELEITKPKINDPIEKLAKDMNRTFVKKAV